MVILYKIARDTNIIQIGIRSDMDTKFIKFDRYIGYFYDFFRTITCPVQYSLPQSCLCHLRVLLIVTNTNKTRCFDYYVVFNAKIDNLVPYIKGPQGLLCYTTLYLISYFIKLNLFMC